MSASRRPLWADEVLTAYMARLRLQDLWSALASGVDLEPPLFHLITRAFTSVMGINPLALRMPAILGGWLMSVSLFVFASRRYKPTYAASAMLIPFISGAAGYTYEARSYGLALGLTGLGLVCWQRAAERNADHRLWLAGLGASLAGAVACHYYMLLAVAAIGLGEAVRTFARRQLDVAVWIALAGGVVPVAFHAPLIQAAMTFTGGTWATASPHALLDAYRGFLSGGVVPLMVVVIGLAAVPRRLLSRSGRDPGARDPGLLRHEVWAAVAFAFSLAGAFVVARLTNGIFTARYGLCLVFGCALVPLPVIARYDAGRPVAGAFLFFGLAASFLSVQVLKHRQRFETPALLLRADESLPVIIEDPLDFVELRYNAPRELASRLRYLASPADSIRYSGSDDDDRGLLLLQRRFPIGVESADSFFRDHQRFLVWQGDRRRRWLLQKLILDHAGITLSGALGAETLFLVTRRAEPL